MHDNNPTKLELYVSDETYCSLDSCLANAEKTDDLFSVLQDVVHSQGPPKRQKTFDLKPIVCVRFRVRKDKKEFKTLKCLIDSGASGSLVAHKFAKDLSLEKSKGRHTTWTTPAGDMNTTSRVRCQFSLPEFHRERTLEWKLHVTQDLGAYDMILGRDVLTGLGIKIDFANNSLEWDSVVIPMKESSADICEAFNLQEPSTVISATDRFKGILEAKYEKADLSEVVKEAVHLTGAEQKKLLDLLKEFPRLFDGTLGKWNMGAYHIELRPDATPYHARAYPIPKAYTETLKVEVNRLVEAGVLKQVNRSEWVAPTFIIPKKDGSVRFISDFRELNKRIRRKPFPIPKIQDMLLKLEGFQYATSLDLNMGYYHIELSPHSKQLCTIVLPWGKYEYQRLPMGLCNSPDIFQEKMSTLMQDLEYVRAYIDDILVITNSTLEDHLDKLREVLKRLQHAGLRVNVKKSFFAKEELEYLGYWISRHGIQPTTAKVHAIGNIATPKTRKELRRFIGMVNYYRDMWIRRSDVLAPLAALTSKTVKWKWTDEHQKAFDTMKKIISKEVLLAYPDFNDEFVIHTDASHTQLGAVISQKGKPIAFYSRKLKPEQTRYTTTERELLSIVETLKEFRNILLGQKIIVHTDHKNLTCKNFNTERVMRWRLVLEEYGPELRYIKGEQNIVADALSRLDMIDNPREPGEQMEPDEMASLFAADADDYPTKFPLSYEEIEQRQRDDAEIQKLRREKPDSYKRTKFDFGDTSYTLVTKDGKIVVPKLLQKKGVQWYHELLMHPGETRTELTMGQHFTWKGMRNTVTDICGKCQACQLQKPKLKRLGHLPPKLPEEIPWECLCIDLIGPYTIGSKAKSDETTLHCLTMIDPVTGWFEIAEIPAKRADEIINVLEQTWFVRYPRPAEVIMDRGREFAAEVRDELQNEFGVIRKLITTRNPQANGMVERAHQTIHNMIAVQNVQRRQDLPGGDWKGILSAVGFAMRATIHTTMRATPMQLVYGRDAIHNVRFEADWQYIKERRQKVILQNNQRENATRIPYTYTIGEQVMIEQHQQRKYGSPRFKGPYTVDRVYDNGTIRVRQDAANGGVVYQTWNIRKIHPYKA